LLSEFDGLQPRGAAGGVVVPLLGFKTNDAMSAIPAVASLVANAVVLLVGSKAPASEYDNPVLMACVHPLVMLVQACSHFS
jgi:hypothetical protein